MTFRRLWLIRALAVCLIPSATAVYFHFNPAERGSIPFLTNGAILACETVFLFKFILFSVIGHHLRGEKRERAYTACLFVPIALSACYTVYYFTA